MPKSPTTDHQPPTTPRHHSLTLGVHFGDAIQLTDRQTGETIIITPERRTAYQCGLHALASERWSIQRIDREDVDQALAVARGSRPSAA